MKKRETETLLGAHGGPHNCLLSNRDQRRYSSAWLPLSWDWSLDASFGPRRTDNPRRLGDPRHQSTSSLVLSQGWAHPNLASVGSLLQLGLGANSVVGCMTCTPDWSSRLILRTENYLWDRLQIYLPHHANFTFTMDAWIYSFSDRMQSEVTVSRFVGVSSIRRSPHDKLQAGMIHHRLGFFAPARSASIVNFSRELDKVLF